MKKELINIITDNIQENGFRDFVKDILLDYFKEDEVNLCFISYHLPTKISNTFKKKLNIYKDKFMYNKILKPEKEPEYCGDCLECNNINCYYDEYTLMLNYYIMLVIENDYITLENTNYYNNEFDNPKDDKIMNLHSIYNNSGIYHKYYYRVFKEYNDVRKIKNLFELLDVIIFNSLHTSGNTPSNIEFLLQGNLGVNGEDFLNNWIINYLKLQNIPEYDCDSICQIDIINLYKEYLKNASMLDYHMKYKL